MFNLVKKASENVLRKHLRIFAVAGSPERRYLQENHGKVIRRLHADVMNSPADWNGDV